MHGITEKDRMAFVGERPWHFGETQQLLLDATEAKKRGEKITARWMQKRVLDWTVETHPVFAEMPFGPFPLRGQQAVMRRDPDGTADWLGAYVSKDYVIVQNDEIAAFADALVEASQGEVYCETAGSLFGGSKVWYLLAMAGALEILRLDGARDKIERYTLVGARHDGRGSILSLPTDVRVVCNNTYTLALAGARSFFSIQHRKNVHDHLAQARLALGLEAKWHDKLGEVAQKFALERFQYEQARAFGAAVIAEVEQVVASVDEVVERLRDKEVAEKTVERIVAEADEVATLFRDGRGNTGETKWDAINGLTEFLDHHRARYSRGKASVAAERRMDSIISGDAMRAKTRAVRLLTRW